MPGKVWELKPSPRPEPGAAIPPKAGGDPDPLGPLPWPSCAQCGKPMRFLFQLTHLRGKLELAPFAAVHVFQCEDPDTFCDAFRPDSGANRVVPVTSGKPALLDAPERREPYPEAFFLTTEAEEDTAALSIDLDTASSEALTARDEAAERAPSSKLGGVPIWLQGEDTPLCCGERMEFLAQLHGETWGLRFGDAGTGYLFRCMTRCATPFKFLWQAG